MTASVLSLARKTRETLRTKKMIVAATPIGISSGSRNLFVKVGRSTGSAAWSGSTGAAGSVDRRDRALGDRLLSRRRTRPPASAVGVSRRS